jgi:uncharacterized protein YxeA
MKKSIMVLIALIVIIIAGAIAAYFYFNNSNKQPIRRNFPFNRTQRNFQLNESQINEVRSFFDANPGKAEIDNYCKDNMANCFYYCRNINPKNDYCINLRNTLPGNYTGRGNYSGRIGGVNSQ